MRAVKGKWSGLSWLFGACLLLSTSVNAATFDVLVDENNNSATGCTVATPEGPFPGVEFIVTTTVDTAVFPPVVTAVTRRDCVGLPSTFSAPSVIDAGGWPVGIGNGAYGAANDIPNVLIGGSGGGGGGRSSGAFTQGGGGGGGGGAIRVIALHSLTLGATATLDVHGGSGGNGTTPPSGNGASGGGGGSGGSIWLSAGVSAAIDPAASLLLGGGVGGLLIVTGAPFTATDGGAGSVGTLLVQP